MSYAFSAAESRYPHLWHGLIAAYAPHFYNGGSVLHDLSGHGRHLTRSGSIPVIRSKRWGNLFDLTSGTAYFENSNVKPLPIVSGQSYSLFIVADVNTSSSLFDCLFRFGANTQFNDFSVLYRSLELRNYCFGNEFDADSSHFVANEVTAFAWHTRATSSGQSDRYIISRGGLQQAYATTTGTNKATFTQLSIGRNAYSGGAVYDGRVGPCYFWVRRLAAADYRLLHADPLAPFRARRRRFYITPSAGNEDNLTATDIATGAPTFDAPTLGQVHALSATEIATTAPTVDAPTLGQTHALSASEIATSAPTLDAPTLAEVGPGVDACTATDIATGSPTFDAPTLGQVHALSATEIATGAPTLDAPTLTTGVHELTASDIATAAPAFDLPTLGQVHALSALGIATGSPTVGRPSDIAAERTGLILTVPRPFSPFVRVNRQPAEVLVYETEQQEWQRRRTFL